MDWDEFTSFIVEAGMSSAGEKRRREKKRRRREEEVCLNIMFTLSWVCYSVYGSDVAVVCCSGMLSRNRL